jgi:hypothetical protein
MALTQAGERQSMRNENTAAARAVSAIAGPALGHRERSQIYRVKRARLKLS